MEARKLALMLYNLGCIHFGNFKLTSGMWSPIYVDLRRIPSHPREFDIIVNMCIEKLKDFKFDVVCGIATGGIPLATLIAYKLNKPLIYIRKSGKVHGLAKLIEGDFKEGMRAIIVDDVSTTGGSLERAVRALNEAKLIVKEALVIVERGQGAIERISTLGVRLHYLIKLIDIIEILYRENLISQQDYIAVKKYLEKGLCSRGGM